MNCWKCGTEVTSSERKISFRAICEHCGFGLHSCKNCKNYAPGKPNDCLIPGTDYISDREANNFCESFSPKLTSTPINIEQNSVKDHKKSFEDLFKD